MRSGLFSLRATRRANFAPVAAQYPGASGHTSKPAAKMPPGLQSDLRQVFRGVMRFARRKRQSSAV